MNDTIWASLALMRLSIRVEMLEMENAALKQELEKLKPPPEEPKKEGLHAVQDPA